VLGARTPQDYEAMILSEEKGVVQFATWSGRTMCANDTEIPTPHDEDLSQWCEDGSPDWPCQGRLWCTHPGCKRSRDEQVRCCGDRADRCRCCNHRF
jgi:hypothetical protein